MVTEATSAITFVDKYRLLGAVILFASIAIGWLVKEIKQLKKDKEDALKQLSEQLLSQARKEHELNMRLQSQLDALRGISTRSNENV